LSKEFALNFVCGMNILPRGNVEDVAEVMSRKNVYKWYKDFKEGRERVQDE